MITCSVCGCELNPRDESSFWVKVEAWERKRWQGGTNHAELRYRLNLFMCNECMTRRQKEYKSRPFLAVAEDPVWPTCVECERRVVLADQDSYHVKVHGWERKRDQGGTNHLALREQHAVFMCNGCMTKLQAGMSAGQLQLV